MEHTSKYLRKKRNRHYPTFWLSFGRHKGRTKSLTSEIYANEANAERGAKSMTEIMVLHLRELGYTVKEPFDLQPSGQKDQN